ncbi:PEGA domain-containing protein, partial [Bordetella petrii]|uniref:PEGA domain-containing protein n=1 Tax=Bordetella petrii TaxID=94624 RepID=UPI001E5C60CD
GMPAPESAEPSVGMASGTAQAPADGAPAAPGNTPLPGDAANPDGAAAPQASDPGAAADPVTADPAATDPAAAGTNPDGTAATAEPVPPEEEKPAEPPQPATVSVRVSVRPWGEVLIDGRSRGISPPLSQVTLPPGRHSVTIRNPAAPDYNTTINVSPGESGSISHVFE